MSDLDPALCARLAAQVADDAPMLEAFREFGDSHLIMTRHGALGTHAVVAVLERERELANQLGAAIAEVERLRAELSADRLHETPEQFSARMRTP